MCLSLRVRLCVLWLHVSVRGVVFTGFVSLCVYLCLGLPRCDFMHLLVFSLPTGTLGSALVWGCGGVAWISLYGLYGALCSVHMTVCVCAHVCSHVPCAAFLQWMEHGQSGASGQPVAQSVPIGAAESAWHPHPRTEAETAAAPCSTPRTAPTGCACRVSPRQDGRGTPSRTPRPHAQPAGNSPSGPLPAHHTHHLTRATPSPSPLPFPATCVIVFPFISLNR